MKNDHIAQHYYAPQDNRADFGPISPLPTILVNVQFSLVVLKIILSDFPVVWGVLRVTESARKNIGGAPIAKHVEYLQSKILMCGREPRGHHTVTL